MHVSDSSAGSVSTPPGSSRNAAFLAAFFLICACVPWLNPFAGGAMTPAIPLLTGWICIAMLFTVFPARRWTPGAAVLAALAD